MEIIAHCPKDVFIGWIGSLPEDELSALLGLRGGLQPTGGMQAALLGRTCGADGAA